MATKDVLCLVNYDAWYEGLLCVFRSDIKEYAIFKFVESLFSVGKVVMFTSM